MFHVKKAESYLDRSHWSWPSVFLSGLSAHWMGVGVEFSLFYVFPSPSLYLSAPSPSVFLVFTPLRPSMQPYYHSGSFPEFLLSLLSNWKPSAKKRPAVSYGCSELDRASSVCAASFLLCAPLCPPLHATSLLSAMLRPQPHCVFLVTGMDPRFRTILLCYRSFTPWLGWTLNRRIDLDIIGKQVMFLPRRVTSWGVHEPQGSKRDLFSWKLRCCKGQMWCSKEKSPARVEKMDDYT